ncbi:MAG: polysaccharide biosynthesis/export family protein [Terriglobales bacterium]
MKKSLTNFLIAIVLMAMPAVAWQEATPPQEAPAPVATTATTGGTTAPAFSERHNRYRLQPSDTIDVVFEYTPEYNQTVTLQPDGYVTLRNVGDVNLHDLTVTQATDVIVQAYSKILSKPKVSIGLKDFQKPYFIADGQVRSPGKYELRGDTTVIQAIAMAGGTQSQYAKHSQVVLYRRVNNTWAEARLLNVKEMQAKHDLSEDVLLQPGDLIFVPKNYMSKVQQWLPIYSVNALGAQSKGF